MLSPLFAGVALAALAACSEAPVAPNTRTANDNNRAQTTILKTERLQGSSTIKGVHMTENGLTAQDYTVDNPRDLAPVDRIVAAAIEKEMAQLEKGQILVVLGGESHPMPAYKLVTAGALSYLTRKRDENPGDESRRFLLAVEDPSNYLVRRAAWEKVFIPGHVKEHINELDPDDILTTRIEASSSFFEAAPKTREKIFQLVLRNRIPTIFNDAARKKNNIDADDQFNRRVYHKLKTELSLPFESYLSELDIYSAKGMAFRNGVMPLRPIARARQLGARTIYQHCGAIHPLGMESINEKYDRSLAVSYRKQGARVLTILAADSKNFLPHWVDERAWKDFPNTVIIRGLDTSTFWSSRPTEETDFIRKLADSYSGGKAPFDFADEPTMSSQEVTESLEELVARGNALYGPRRAPGP